MLCLGLVFRGLGLGVEGLWVYAGFSGEGL